jgi:hypothetical protein
MGLLLSSRETAKYGLSIGKNARSVKSFRQLPSMGEPGMLNLQTFLNQNIMNRAVGGGIQRPYVAAFFA